MGVVALVPAAGRGERLGYGMPKALVPVAGVPLLVRAVRGLFESGCVRHVVIAAPPSDVDVVNTVTAPLAPAGGAVHVVPGGAERSDSVRSALVHALRAIPGTTVVLVHDAARAFTPPEVVRAVVEAVRAGNPAVVPVLPVVDTVKEVDAGGLVVATPDRSALRVVQTPQGFDARVLLRAHEAASSATDDAGLVERLGVKVATVPGHQDAMKITTPFDLAVAEALLAGGGA
ncbi:2-C-methyl-D-erythritol 4-phosphate cytidylyltransferase [Saccharothrix algeriensis]|uniref:2-C-methyl-D-erythritol 4-phosphate cytidylyltransferase n=1 Tax=Saccharothrix algeriensis TaxID=173560 RepID=A0A8T8I4N4_9PSEU|nr:2-C-methyl-D-erythritol 4-phosphate cytidylyltransferase [Saccharothrix algeriensis]MBM7811798.1 2-C-methyl-D-erythritol 4-phosphate cytidylyltransferase [Saccharothrix algeriensis]QTR05538.1 2-C-methyl-D-erythritol 4-phosphate cytidylyltransferase [Saccharothrix algeriensis]